MASINKITTAYRGKMATGYEAKRIKQKRWHGENLIVEKMLREIKPRKILDCPVGTGRFLPIYRRLSISGVVGIDSSEAMLAEAKKKKFKYKLQQGFADSIEYDDLEFDTSVSVRFFNLIEPAALREVFSELSRVTSRHMICTIRLGPEYHSNSSMCTHD